MTGRGERLHGPRRPRERELDWEAVRFGYLQSGMSEVPIAWKHGTTKDALRQRERALRRQTS